MNSTMFIDVTTTKPEVEGEATASVASSSSFFEAVTFGLPAGLLALPDGDFFAGVVPEVVFLGGIF